MSFALCPARYQEILGAVAEKDRIVRIEAERLEGAGTDHLVVVGQGGPARHRQLRLSAEEMVDGVDHGLRQRVGGADDDAGDVAANAFIIHLVGPLIQHQSSEEGVGHLPRSLEGSPQPGNLSVEVAVQLGCVAPGRFSDVAALGDVEEDVPGDAA